jgi:hypothetical protein
MIFYRAMPIEADGIRSGDYLTPSLKFAREHALTTSVYHGEDYGVFVVLMGKDEYREASNPGEYIYIGEGKPARLVGIAKYNDEYADSEYQRVKIGSKETLSPSQSRLALLVENANLSKNFALKHNKQKLKKGAGIDPMATNRKNRDNNYKRKLGSMSINDIEINMLKELVKLANDLDSKGLTKEADALDEIIKKAGWLDYLQAGLSAVGLIPGAGEAFDAANALISASRGKYVNAILSAISMIPTIGDIIGKGTMMLFKAMKDGSNQIKWLTHTYTISGLALFIQKELNKIPLNDIQEVLATADKFTRNPEGTLYSIYLNDIKKVVDRQAMSA